MKKKNLFLAFLFVFLSLNVIAQMKVITDGNEVDIKKMILTE